MPSTRAPKGRAPLLELTGMNNQGADARAVAALEAATKEFADMFSATKS